MARAIVTRPAHEAQAWVADLRASGVDAVSMPLIGIGPVADSAALAQAWNKMHQYDAVMFVSGNAVRHFFAWQPGGISLAWGAPLRAWVTGPGTQRALLACGVPPDCMDAPALDGAQFDSEALWAVVAPQVAAGTRVLIVRGHAAGGVHARGSAPGAGRDWLARHIEAAGGMFDFVVAYERRAPVWSAADLDGIARAAVDGSVWILSSAEGLGYLLEAAPQQSWRQARAVATHPRIAAMARQAGFAWVQETRPVLAEIVASIESCA